MTRTSLREMRSCDPESTAKTTSSLGRSPELPLRPPCPQSTRCAGGSSVGPRAESVRPGTARGRQDGLITTSLMTKFSPPSAHVRLLKPHPPSMPFTKISAQYGHHMNESTRTCFMTTVVTGLVPSAAARWNAE